MTWSLFISLEIQKKINRIFHLLSFFVCGEGCEYVCSHNFKRSFLHSFYSRCLVENYTHLTHSLSLALSLSISVNVGELLSKDKPSHVFHAFIVVSAVHSINFKIHVRIDTQTQTHTQRAQTHLHVYVHIHCPKWETIFIIRSRFRWMGSCKYYLSRSLSSFFLLFSLFFLRHIQKCCCCVCAHFPHW